MEYLTQNWAKRSLALLTDIHSLVRQSNVNHQSHQVPTTVLTDFMQHTFNDKLTKYFCEKAQIKQLADQH